eukprot:5188843-Pyramimonas_sp.AAC.1
MRKEDEGEVEEDEDSRAIMRGNEEGGKGMIMIMGTRGPCSASACPSRRPSDPDAYEVLNLRSSMEVEEQPRMTAEEAMSE